jgi:hypothetical protein
VVLGSPTLRVVEVSGLFLSLEVTQMSISIAQSATTHGLLRFQARPHQRYRLQVFQARCWYLIQTLYHTLSRLLATVLSPSLAHAKTATLTMLVTFQIQTRLCRPSLLLIGRTAVINLPLTACLMLVPITSRCMAPWAITKQPSQLSQSRWPQLA